MNLTRTYCCDASHGEIRISRFCPFLLIWLTLTLLCCGFISTSQGQGLQNGQATAPATPQLRPQSNGSISGIVIYKSGAPIAGAQVTLTREGQPNQIATSGDDGQFSFANVTPGAFKLTVTASNFDSETVSGTLHSGQIYTVDPIVLALASPSTQVQVVAPEEEIAEAEVKAEEKQRVLDVIPNFYVAYDPQAVPLHPKQKFELAWKTIIDPVTIGITGGVAGIQQAQNRIPEYGQGAAGYGKRFGAAYAGTVTGTFIGGAILPSLLKQDPRYFYKGTGGVRARLFYAIANAFICKGDNKKWQPNYSAVLGGIASGGLSNLYYPAADRQGVGLTFENALIDLGTSAASNVLQEFVVRKFTSNTHTHDPAKS